MFILVTKESKKSTHIYKQQIQVELEILGEIYTKHHIRGENRWKNCGEKAQNFYIAEYIHRVFYEKIWLIRKSLDKISGFKRRPIK